MSHYSSHRATKLPVGAIRGVADTLIAMGYASSFAIDEKRKLYDFVWTDKGAKLANEVRDLYHQSINRSVVDYGVDDPTIGAALLEILYGTDLPE